MIVPAGKLASPSVFPPKAKGNYRGDANKLMEEDRPAHDWYRFVLSYPPHLVRQYLTDFHVKPSQAVLDPFCGTGTTLVECKKLGIPSVGIEANDLAHFVSSVKVDWTIHPKSLLENSRHVADKAAMVLEREGIDDNGMMAFRPAPTSLRSLPAEQMKLLLTNSISPLPLHKTLVLIDAIKRHGDERFVRHELLALARALVATISNLHFGPEVGVGPPKPDAPVLSAWLSCVKSMAADLAMLNNLKSGTVDLRRADSRDLRTIVQPESISAVITSPPYPNEKDYTRTTRLESVLLGFLHTKQDLQSLKRTLMRSNTRNVYKGDDDDKWVENHPEIQQIATAIEARRIDLGKTSGFERMYARVTKLYFGGMARHLADLRGALKPGALLAYVVGDQASYLQVMIRTGKLLGEIAQSLGYELVRIDLFRTRLATATRQQLREEAVILRWPGKRKGHG
jgi:DNA modification methylase